MGRGTSPVVFVVSFHYECFGWEKSKRRAIDRLTNSSPGLVSFLLRRLGGALTAGPVPLRSILPSTSSRGRDDADALTDFGSLEECEGLGRAKK